MARPVRPPWPPLHEPKEGLGLASVPEDLTNSLQLVPWHWQRRRYISTAERICSVRNRCKSGGNRLQQSIPDLPGSRPVLIAMGLQFAVPISPRSPKKKKDCLYMISSEPFQTLLLRLSIFRCCLCLSIRIPFDRRVVGALFLPQ